MATHALLRGLLIAASLLCAGQAWAVCSYSPRMNLGDIVINPGLVRVAQDAAIGAIVGSQTVGIPNTGGLIWIGQCAANGYGGFNIALNVNQGTSVAGQSNVYSTNIQGIGFRIRTLGSNANTWPTGVGVFNAAAASVYIGWRQIQFDLVKTAAIVGNGQLTPGEYGRAQVSGNPFDQYFRVVVAGGSILTPPAASMPARKTSPCRSARSIARPFRARVPRRRPALSRSGSTAIHCRQGKGTRS